VSAPKTLLSRQPSAYSEIREGRNETPRNLTARLRFKSERSGGTQWELAQKVAARSLTCAKFCRAKGTLFGAGTVRRHAPFLSRRGVCDLKRK